MKPPSAQKKNVKFTATDSIMQNSAEMVSEIGDALNSGRNSGREHYRFGAVGNDYSAKKVQSREPSGL